MTKQFKKGRAEELATRDVNYCKAHDTKTTILTRKTKEINGRIVPYLTTETIDQAEIMQQYNINDFSLENLIELGADKDLSETRIQLDTLLQMDIANAYAQKFEEENK